MRFVKVRDTKLKPDYDWMADIRSLADLMEVEKLFTSRNAFCIMDYIGSRDYANEMNAIFEGSPIKKDGVNYQDHCHPRNILRPFFFASLGSIPENTKVSPLLYFAEKLDGVIGIKASELAKHGRILINQNGGFFTWREGIKELESREANYFPQYDKRNIKVSKYPNGTHWYITCNGTSIVVDGIEKWKTEKTAWAASERWLKESAGKSS